MNPIEMHVHEIREKALPSGELITIGREALSLWVVECWDAQGSNRWHKAFHHADLAQREYDRWN